MRSWCACPLCREIGFYCGTSSVVILQSQLKVTQFCMFNKFHINQYLCIFYVSSDMSKHDNAIPWLIYPYIQCIVKALSNVINCQSQSNLLENWVQSEHHLLTRLVFSSFWWVSKPNVWTCYKFLTHMLAHLMDSMITKFHLVMEIHLIFWCNETELPVPIISSISLSFIP